MQPSDALRVLSKALTIFSRGRCVRSCELTHEVIEFLKSEDLIYLGINGDVCIKSLVKLALEAIALGADPTNVSSYLSWRDFEEFTTEYLQLSNYLVVRNLRFTYRRLEIDVLGVNTSSALGIAIDCKHWGPGYSKKGKLITVASVHRSKVEYLSSECSSIMGKYPLILRAKYFIPAIVTLTESVKGYLNGSFIVPISSFNDFIVNIRYYVDLLTNISDMVLNKCYIGS